MDEPCSALDPVATNRIEDLMSEMKSDFTIVTHNMQQAARVSDLCAFFTTEVNEKSDIRTGVLVEQDRTDRLFSNHRMNAPRTTSPAGSGRAGRNGA